MDMKAIGSKGIVRLAVKTNPIREMLPLQDRIRVDLEKLKASGDIVGLKGGVKEAVLSNNFSLSRKFALVRKYLAGEDRAEMHKIVVGSVRDKIKKGIKTGSVSRFDANDAKACGIFDEIKPIAEEAMRKFLKKPGEEYYQKYENYAEFAQPFGLVELAKEAVDRAVNLILKKNDVFNVRDIALPIATKFGLDDRVKEISRFLAFEEILEGSGKKTLAKYNIAKEEAKTLVNDALNLYDAAKADTSLRRLDYAVKLAMEEGMKKEAQDFIRKRAGRIARDASYRYFMELIQKCGLLDEIKSTKHMRYILERELKRYAKDGCTLGLDAEEIAKLARTFGHPDLARDAGICAITWALRSGAYARAIKLSADLGISEMQQPIDAVTQLLGKKTWSDE